MAIFSSKGPSHQKTLIRGILSLALGILCIAVPGITINTVIVIIGAVLIISGLTSLWIARKNRQNPINNIVRSQGWATIVFGLVLALFPSVFVSIFVVLFGIGLILIGASQLISISVSSRNFGFSLLGAIIGGATIIGGFVLLSDPFESAQAILIFIGIFLAAYGVAQIIWSNRLWNYRKKNPPQNTVDTDFEEVE